MSLDVTPTPARTDAPPNGSPRPAPVPTMLVPPAPAQTAPAPPASVPTAPTPAPTPSVPTRPVRLAGLAMAAGAVAWAVGTLVFDPDPVTDEFPVLYKASSLLFQLGLVALVAVQLRTRATGTGRLARGFLHAEHVMLALAIASSVQWMVAPDLSENAFFLTLDLFWPLSMLGMAAIGIRIAIAGRWRGAARVWPAIAETWALVMFPALAVLSEESATYVSAGHLFVGYTALGLILAVRPELTGARDR